MFITLMLLVGCAQGPSSAGGVRAEKFYVGTNNRTIRIWMATTPAGDTCYIYDGGHTQISCVKGE